MIHTFYIIPDPPSDKTTHVMYNYTTEGNPFIQLHFTKVFPLPNCTVTIKVVK